MPLMEIENGIIVGAIGAIPGLPTNQTANRNLDIWYHNTTGRNLLVIVTFTPQVTSINDSAEVAAYISKIADYTLGSLAANGIYSSPALELDTFLAFVVPPDYYYIAKRDLYGAGTVAYGTWQETQL